MFGEEEIAAARSTKMFIDAGVSEDAIAEITRVLGEAMARVAASTMAAFADTFLQAGDSEQDVAWRFAELAEQLVPAFSPVLLAAYQAHLRETVQRGMISREELAAGQLVGEQDMAVCFADVVGFTTLGGQVETEELGSVITRFGELAAEVASPRVRLVKTIGDAAMMTCREPEPLVEAALELLGAVEAADLPSVRAGIAYGPALQRAGDVYGHAVNVASRVTGVARPGKHRLKGLDESIPLYRARPLETEAGDADEAERRDGRSARKQPARRRRRRESR